MTPLDEALMFSGITPPRGNSHKTRCPVCSAGRTKSAQPCLSVYPKQGRVEWACHHCGWEDQAVIA